MGQSSGNAQKVQSGDENPKAGRYPGGNIGLEKGFLAIEGQRMILTDFFGVQNSFGIAANLDRARSPSEAGRHGAVVAAFRFIVRTFSERAKKVPLGQTLAREAFPNAESCFCRKCAMLSQSNR